MLLGANGRQVDAGHSTAAVAVGQRRVAVMQLRYLRNETQAQATTAAPAVGSRQRVEAFEHATDGVVRYARAAIGNIDAHATGFPLHRDVDHAARSEEHTSEPQALMRISYTGFCLKK